MYIQMTEEEVRRDVRLAKSPEVQIEILADINGVTVEVIQRILNGESWDETTDDVKPKKVSAPDKSTAPSKAERKNHRWTRAELLRIKELRERGIFAEQIAVEFKVTPCAIKSVIQNHPKIFPRKGRYRSISEADLERAFECRARGMAYKEIGEQLGVAGMTIRATMIRAKRKAAHDVAAS